MASGWRRPSPSTRSRHRWPIASLSSKMQKMPGRKRWGWLCTAELLGRRKRKQQSFFFSLSVEFKCFLWRRRTKSCHMSRPPPGWARGEERDLAAAHISSFAESAYFPQTLPRGREVRRALGRSRFGSGLCQSLVIQGLASSLVEGKHYPPDPSALEKKRFFFSNINNVTRCDQPLQGLMADPVLLGILVSNQYQIDTWLVSWYINTSTFFTCWMSWSINPFVMFSFS